MKLFSYHPSEIGLTIDTITQELRKGLDMGEKLDPKETVKVEDLLRMEMVINQALINILVRKGITTEAEIMAEVKRIKQEQGIVVG